MRLTILLLEKRIKFLCLLLLFSKLTSAQYYGEHKQIIQYADSLAEFGLSLSDVDVKISDKKVYHWYRWGKINATQGGFSGVLLDGKYQLFDASGQIMKQGNFKKGIRSGKWKYWSMDGSLWKIEKWRSGILKKTVHMMRKEKESNRFAFLQNWFKKK